MRVIKVKWDGPEKILFPDNPKVAGIRERSGTTAEGEKIEVKWCPDEINAYIGNSKIFLSGKQIGAAYCHYLPDAMAKYPQAFSFKMEEI